MATGVSSWSKTAANNATADSSAQWPEGMPPSQVNDSARGMMASVAKWRDDVSGSLTTSGTASAYTISSNQGFASLSVMDEQVIAFTPHVINGTAPTLSVDGLTAKPIRSEHGVDLPSNILLPGTPYVALFSNGNSEFILQGMTANPFGIPLASGFDYWADDNPSSAYVRPTGQALARVGIYAPLFAKIGTKYGAGDGSTFNLPDKRERVSVMTADVATRLTAAYFGGDSTQLGATGGSESKVVITANLPPLTPAGTIQITDPGHGHAFPKQYLAPTFGIPGNSGLISNGGNGFDFVAMNGAATGISAAFTGTQGGGNSTPVAICQPTIVCNYLMRVI